MDGEEEPAAEKRGQKREEPAEQRKRKNGRE
jgi:hypothetical protein